MSLRAQNGHRPLTGGESSPESSGASEHAAKEYRSDLKTVTEAELINRHGVDPKKAEKKARDIQFVVSLMEQHEPFPGGTRPWRDAFCIAPFLIICGLVFGGALLFYGPASQELHKLIAEEQKAAKTTTLSPSSSTFDSSELVAPTFAALAVSLVASLVGALAFIWMSMVATACVVWTSLFLTPVILFCLGAACFVMGQALIGMVFMFLGSCFFFCTWCCWRRFIPFTIRVLETVSEVMTAHPALCLVSIGGRCMQVVWFVCTCVAVGGAYITTMGDSIKESHSGEEPEASGADYLWIFLFGFALYSGSSVLQFTCDVTYAGVFGRWYFQETDNSLMASMKVAWTTSFGSICFGSMALAFVRALDMVVTTARKAAQEEGNIVTCILLLVVECLIGCIGDLLEYVTEWAMVQVAIRGVGLLDAGRILGSLVLCSNSGLILADLLLGSVTSCGTLFCGFIGAIAGGLAGLAFGPSGAYLWAASGTIGFILGSIIGRAALDPIQTGTKTIISLWAEDPNPLMEFDHDMHNEFESKIQSKM
eukprot:CAMPEP_0206484824 /NCGR_PEP_ID=MMETSP0324_2-20121206/40183_1 /ASSEMBLY_ACC=CAM_ASM_000836 /TAXON_ID=2866 /ORGANISM="Crypthecodinium cohnii, Strain Seligo" /LENGTH=536 /DNA_ID=CAMNT_0053963003 /DNA_START=70 /DNA_END=1680 /DNA_ORIENTATION=-